jgi:hypothetical protein
VRTRLAAADSKNAEVQRDLSISHEKIGNMLVRSGDQAGALAQYRQSLTIDTKLQETDPDNAQARLDCASSHEKIGELQMSSGDLAGALASEDQARLLREWVALKDQKNVDVRGDLVLNYKQLGAVNAALAKKSGNPRNWTVARGWYVRALDTLRDLQQRGALDADGAEEMKSTTAELANCDSALRTGESKLP